MKRVISGIQIVLAFGIVAFGGTAWSSDDTVGTIRVRETLRVKQGERSIRLGQCQLVFERGTDEIALGTGLNIKKITHATGRIPLGDGSEKSVRIFITGLTIQSNGVSHVSCTVTDSGYLSIEELIAEVSGSLEVSIQNQ